jgi:SAM-dependent methyltransferase
MKFKNFYEEGQSDNIWDCDKGTNHSYIEHYYDLEFSDKRANDLNFLEIGIWEGGSLRLWKSWFINANIIGIDDNSGIFGNLRNSEFNNIPGTKTIWGDAYCDEIVNKFENNYFDYIIDDGPHTFESHELCIAKWLPKLKPGGKLVIEDIYYLSEDPSPLVGKQLVSLIYNNFYDFRFFDFREIKGRGDDIILEITKKI